LDLWQPEVLKAKSVPQQVPKFEGIKINKVKRAHSCLRQLHCDVTTKRAQTYDQNLTIL
jgi:hypothetical protein